MAAKSGAMSITMNSKKQENFKRKSNKNNKISSQRCSRKKNIERVKS